MNILDSLLKYGLPNACFMIGVLAIIIGICIDSEGPIKIRNRRALAWIGAALVALAAALPYASRLAPPTNFKSEVHSFDTGLVGSLFFTKSGEFQVQLEAGFPKGTAAYGKYVEWPVGDHLPDLVKQALVTAKASKTPVGIRLRGHRGDKPIIAEIFIGVIP